MAETTSYPEPRLENNNVDGKSRSKGMEKKLSGRLAEAMKILRVRKSLRPSMSQISRIEEPDFVISELPCPDPAYELPCRDFVQDNRNVSDIYREHQQALFVAWPDVEFQRIKRTRGERTSGTCEWLLEKGPFVNWIAGRAPQVLRIIGDADMGKTMLITFLIERLSTTLRVTPGMTLAYHFCDNENQSSNTAIAIVKTILYQLFQQQPRHFQLLQTSYENYGHNLFRNFSVMWSVLLDIIQAFEEDDLFILIDALDECEAQDRDLLLDGLICIAHSNKNVRLLFTCRPVEWAAWASRGQKVGLASMTIDFRDISGDVKKVVDDKLPSFREHYNWDDSWDRSIRGELNNPVTGAFPVSAFRLLSQAEHGQASGFLRKLLGDIRSIQAHADLKRSLSENPAKDSPSFDVRSIRSLPEYRPPSIQIPMPLHPPSHNAPQKVDGDELDGLEALRSSLSSAAGLLHRSASDPLTSGPFSIVPTPATSRNPSQSKPSGRQSPVSVVEEGEEAEEGEQPIAPIPQRSPSQHLRNSFACFECCQPQDSHDASNHHHAATRCEAAAEQSTTAGETSKHEGDSNGSSKQAKESTAARSSTPSSDSSSVHSQPEPLFNPAHPVSMLIERSRSHAKDAALLLLLLVALRPFWIELDWRALISISAGLAGVAYLAYECQWSRTRSSRSEQPPNDQEYSGDRSSYQGSSGSSSLSSSIFSGFTSYAIYLYRGLLSALQRRDRDGGDDNGSPPPPPPTDPELGYQSSSDCNPDGLSFWVLACLFIFITLGGFAVVAQTIACVRVHDESLLPSYVLPTRDDTDHWELLSNSAFLLVSIFLQSFVSVVHIRRNKDMGQWAGLWVCNGLCLTTVPVAIRLYLEMRYVSKAVTGAGNLIQVIVTFFTILKLEQISQKKMWLQREETVRGHREVLDALREENLQLRMIGAPASPPQTPSGGNS